MSDLKNSSSNTPDDKLWETVTKKDKKYSKANRMVFNKKPSTKNNKNIPKTSEEKIKTKIEKKPFLVKEKVLLEEALDPIIIPSGISLNQAEKLKKGNIRPEVRIDLHGFTQDKANTYLKDKLTEFYKINIRCVLVITGKKLGKHGAEGVLKREVPRWLNIPPLRQMILMTSWAQPKDGGHGALYVLLKKRR